MFPLQGGNPAATQIYSDDVFSAYTYTGTGASLTINNGINLSTNGGLVWMKSRSAATDHALYDTARGATFDLVSNSSASQTTQTTGLTAFNSNGFTVGALAKINTSAATYVGWTFRKAPKFFDVVTYTGNGANRTISHSLGSVPGMIIVKRTDAAADWQVYSNSIANTEYMVLNTTAAKATGATRWNSTTPTSSVFSLGTDTTVNASAGTYVAYLFAHDTTSTGIVQCGSFTTDASANPVTVNLGWEPQFVLTKRTSLAGSWNMLDTMRGFSQSATDAALFSNTAAAESSSSNYGYPTATGFYYNGEGGANTTIIYLAIRMPNKPPTVGTQVYNAIARTGTGAVATITGVGFAPDLVIAKDRQSATPPPSYVDRLRGVGINLASSSTAAETADATGVTSFSMNGVALGASTNFNATDNYINWFFKRAPGVFDEVCYTGTGVAGTQAHSLGVAPELMIVKQRNAANDWPVYAAPSGNNKVLYLNFADAQATRSEWNNTTPTASVFSLNSSAAVNQSSSTYVAYLFATKAGISKVGSYTGNGSSQTINAGFTTGARWVMIKRTDSTGDWYVWDSTRGIVAGNDPHLSLNTVAAEVTTDDSVDTNTTGFIVNQLAATNINVNAATYIYLSLS